MQFIANSCYLKPSAHQPPTKCPFCDSGLDGFQVHTLALLHLEPLWLIARSKLACSTFANLPHTARVSFCCTTITDHFVNNNNNNNNNNRRSFCKPSPSASSSVHLQAQDTRDRVEAPSENFTSLYRLTAAQEFKISRSCWFIRLPIPLYCQSKRPPCIELARTGISDASDSSGPASRSSTRQPVFKKVRVGGGFSS